MGNLHAGENQQLIAGAAPNPKFFRSASVASFERPSGAADFPSPWQGTIALPGSDEETVNTAQVYIYEHCKQKVCAYIIILWYDNQER